MRSFIPLSRPNITEQDIANVVAVLKTGMLVQGKNVEALEQKINHYLGTTSVAAVSNGTSTMHLALKVLGIGPGDEVIVPAFSYVATANVVELVGATPIFVDIDIRTFNIDVAQISAKITPKTKAIIPVHEFGLCADMDPILALAKTHDLFVIEDAACALGASYKGKKSGTFGDFGSFSLHPRKAVTSGEGGLLVSKNPVHDEQVKTLRNHGIRMDNGQMNFVEAGFNYRMTDFQAALVLGQVDAIESMMSCRDKIAAVYFDQLKTDKMSLPLQAEGYRHAWQSFHVVLDDAVNRNEMIGKLKEKQIGSNYGAQCIPAMTYYRQKYALKVEELFPNAWRAYQQGLVLPMFDLMTTDEADYVSDVLNDLLR